MEEYKEKDQIPHTYTTQQIADLLQIGPTSAGKVMREIKSVSDTLGIAGLVHVQDYNYWLSIRLGKGKNDEKPKSRRRRTAHG